jgi:hypothetical protein
LLTAVQQPSNSLHRAPPQVACLCYCQPTHTPSMHACRQPEVQAPFMPRHYCTDDHMIDHHMGRPTTSFGHTPSPQPRAQGLCQAHRASALHLHPPHYQFSPPATLQMPLGCTPALGQQVAAVAGQGASAWNPVQRPSAASRNSVRSSVRQGLHYWAPSATTAAAARTEAPARPQAAPVSVGTRFETAPLHGRAPAVPSTEGGVPLPHIWPSCGPALQVGP